MKIKIENLNLLVELGYIENYDYYDKSVYLDDCYIGEVRVDFCGNVKSVLIDVRKETVDEINKELFILEGLM